MNVASQVGARLYRIGSTGPVVQSIQKSLASCGYALKGTGYFGSSTDVAVEAFQKRAGLRVDGVVGKNTAAALDAAATSNRSDIPEVITKEIGRPLWLEAGIKLLGTNEGPGSRDNATLIDWAHEEGGDIAKQYTHDSIPWCALFANHCLTKVGLKGTETLWALDFAGKWPAIHLAGPAVGAFAPMLRDGGGHIIIIAGRDQYGNVMGLGGNQSDTVSIIPFPMSRLNRGFWWPISVSAPKVTGINSLPVVLSSGNLSSQEQ